MIVIKSRSSNVWQANESVSKLTLISRKRYHICIMYNFVWKRL